MQSVRLASLLSLAAVLLFSACSTDAPTAPLAPSAPVSATSSASIGFVAPPLTLEQLHAKRDSVRTAQKELRASLKAEYALLKQTWRLVRKDVKVVGATVLRCSPVEYTGSAEVIGPAGGTISVGANKLIIPQGALKQNILITMERPMGELVSATFGPHGLKFIKTSHLTLDYGTCFVPTTAQLGIVYGNATGTEIYEILPPKQTKISGTVSTSVDHFSSYMIAY